MNFSDYEFLPGTVINVEDPEKRGRIKASVPTWFDTNVMQEEALPWIVPSSMGGYQRFSKLENGSKVWVIHKKKSNKEYWYLPLFELDDKTKEIVDDYNAPEVLLSRSDGNSGVYVYYNTKDGLVLKNGQLEVVLNNDKQIHITDGTTSFDLEGSKITIGNGNNPQSTLMGENVKNMLSTFASELLAIGGEMALNDKTSFIGPKIVKCATKMQEACNDILSNTVKISM